MSDSKLKEKSITVLNENEILNILKQLPLNLHSNAQNMNQIGGIPYDIFGYKPNHIKSEKQGELSPILIREQTQILMNKIRTGKISEKHVLYGFNGAGKSYILYHLAAYFSQFDV
eukprot:Anaeramoba_ignava/c17856_g1_i1.p1 GENE.c17856_g1_i1~~c17856_g1_i1.p1  ORF type:complete len:115 (-),score=34.52 c17856_g1_i1:181-525(-)